MAAVSARTKSRRRSGFRLHGQIPGSRVLSAGHHFLARHVRAALELEALDRLQLVREVGAGAEATPAVANAARLSRIAAASADRPCTC
jgi:hypothetical protein